MKVFRWKWIKWPSALLGLAAGTLIFFDMGRRAFYGEPDAIGLLASYLALVVIVILGIRKFWTVILDERDALDIFKEFAIARDARIRHIRNEKKLASGNIVEDGYELTCSDHGHEIDISLVHVGRKQETSRNLLEEHDLLLLRVQADHDLQLSIVNPQHEIENTLDVDLYSPRILSSRKYYYYQHGIIFSDYSKERIDRLFDHSFIQIQLFALFVNYRFKVVIFDAGFVLAVKAVSMTSMHMDMDAYTALINLARVLMEQSKLETQTIPS